MYNCWTESPTQCLGCCLKVKVTTRFKSLKEYLCLRLLWPNLVGRFVEIIQNVTWNVGLWKQQFHWSKPQGGFKTIYVCVWHFTNTLQSHFFSWCIFARVQTPGGVLPCKATNRLVLLCFFLVLVQMCLDRLLLVWTVRSNGEWITDLCKCSWQFMPSGQLTVLVIYLVTEIYAVVLICNA